MSEREQIAGLLDVIERRFAELNEQPMALATRWHAEDGEREVQKLRQLLVEALTAPAPAAPTEAVKSSGIFGFIDIDARNALRDAELLATMAQPAPAPAAPTEANEYTTVETACRGCMGPCGRCHELQQAIELLKHVRVLDCGAHYCRYCPAKSPAWEHAPHCPYEESQKRNDEARKLRAQLSAALSTPSAGWQAIMRGAAVTCESSPGNRRVVIQCGDDLNKAQRIFAALTAARE